MKHNTLVRRQYFNLPPEKVFNFFESPENLARITPPWLDFQILTPTPIDMRQGTIIDYTFRWLAFPIRWTTLITTYEPPIRFVDEQIRGPYSLWHHTHTFREKDGGTEMAEGVRYILPLGVVGRIAHELLVRKQLQEIFDYRASVITGLLRDENAAGIAGMSIIREDTL